jgi:hypothetical protein
MEFLPVHHPTAEEKNDAKLYARNVRLEMADALQIPTVNLWFEDAKEWRDKAKEMDVATEAISA